jgi:uncharacterized membrane-anchored protein
MNRRAKQLILACSVPLLILLGMCFTPLYTLLTGEEVILRTMPVDPSDVFRGDYVALRYEAEEVPKSLVEEKVISKVVGEHRSSAVYVVLKEQNGIYTPTKVTLDKPAGGVYLKGVLNFIGTNMNGNEVAYIKYSMDKYFVEDNTGAAWEKASAKGEILAKVKVKNGYAILTGITK